MRPMKTVLAAAIAAALLVVPAGALAKRDRNHDRIPDKWEMRHHLSTRVNVARQDPDHDGLSNLSEFRHGTNPRKADTDGDGIDDGMEVKDDTNPTADDSDNDGVMDDQEIAGTIVSFDNGVLTIQLPADGAGTVSGMVNDQTRIECDDQNDDAPAATMSEDGGSGSGDNSGSGSDDNSGSGSTTSGSDDGANQESGDDNTTQSGSNTSGDDDANDDAGDDDGNDENACTSADLKPGAHVHEAKFVQSTDGSTVFTKIELVPAA
jgi:Bacterial TSP3 repeat